MVLKKFIKWFLIGIAVVLLVIVIGALPCFGMNFEHFFVRKD